MAGPARFRLTSSRHRVGRDAVAQHLGAVACSGGVPATGHTRGRAGGQGLTARGGADRRWDRRDGGDQLRPPPSARAAGPDPGRRAGRLGAGLPGLAMAARTVGSPQIRNRGTVGGNLGSASPAGDAHPALLAAGAQVELASVRGTRLVSLDDFFTGPKRHVGEPDELITAVLVRPASGPQQFAKVGTRNAMVIAVSAFGFALHPDRREVGTGIGSAHRTPRRAADAERYLAAALDWDSTGALDADAAREFGARVAAATDPIDDVRGTAAYRRHSVAVMARRCAGWAWDDLRRGA